MTSVLDHSGKLIEQKTLDPGLTHTPTRRDNKRRSASRRSQARAAAKPTPQLPGHMPDGSAEYNSEV